MSKGGGIKVLHVNKAVLPEFAHTKSEFRAERKAALQDLDELERLRCRVKSISQESSAEYVPQFEIVLRSKALSDVNWHSAVKEALAPFGDLAGCRRDYEPCSDRDKLIWLCRCRFLDATAALRVTELGLNGRLRILVREPQPDGTLTVVEHPAYVEKRQHPRSALREVGSLEVRSREVRLGLSDDLFRADAAVPEARRGLLVLWRHASGAGEQIHAQLHPGRRVLSVLLRVGAANVLRFNYPASELRLDFKLTHLQGKVHLSRDSGHAAILTFLFRRPPLVFRRTPDTGGVLEPITNEDERSEFTRCTDLTSGERLGLSNACQLLFPFLAPPDSIDPSLTGFLDLLGRMGLADPVFLDPPRLRSAEPPPNEPQPGPSGGGGWDPASSLRCHHGFAAKTPLALFGNCLGERFGRWAREDLALPFSVVYRIDQLATSGALCPSLRGCVWHFVKAVADLYNGPEWSAKQSGGGGGGGGGVVRIEVGKATQVGRAKGRGGRGGKTRPEPPPREAQNRRQASQQQQQPQIIPRGTVVRARGDESSGEATTSSDEDGIVSRVMRNESVRAPQVGAGPAAQQQRHTFKVSTVAALDRLVAKAHRMRGCRLFDIVESLHRAYREQSAPGAVDGRGAAVQGDIHGKPLPAHLLRVCRVCVTPTRVICFPPEVEVANRVSRLFGPARAEECLLRVTFCDENLKTIFQRGEGGDQLQTLYDHVKQALTHGIWVGGRLFKFLAFSSNQLRNRGCWFYAPPDRLSLGSAAERRGDPSADHVFETAERLRLHLGHFAPIRVAAKHAARIGQCFSTTVATVRVSEGREWRRRAPDVERGGFCFSDGCGTVIPALAEEMWARYREAAKAFQEDASFPRSFFSGQAPGGADAAEEAQGPAVPSAFQIRLGGCKGMVSLDVRGQGRRITTRKSMDKFDAAADPSAPLPVEVCAVSKCMPCYTNRQLIAILSSVWRIPDDTFLSMQEAMVRELDRALENDRSARRVLRSFGGLSAVLCEDMLRALNAGVPITEPFHQEIMRCIRQWHLQELLGRARIFVQDGATLFGVMDETGLLEYGEVFAQVTDWERGEEGRPTREVSGPVAVTKFPALHPGDVRALRGVSVGELEARAAGPEKAAEARRYFGGLVNVLVFPQKGPRPHPNEMAGSDLDGDEYFLTWDRRLIPPPGHENAAAMDYTPAGKAQETALVHTEQIVDFFIEYMKRDNLGQIANAHLVWADRRQEGVRSDECLRLAKLQSSAVDFAKTGLPAELPGDLRHTDWPHWMRKKDKPMYTSETVIGKLFDAAKGAQRERAAVWPSSSAAAAADSVGGQAAARPPLSPDPDFRVDGWERYRDAALKARDRYAFEVLSIMDHWGVSSEAELVSGHILRLCREFRSGRSGGDVSADIRDKVGLEVFQLRQRFREVFAEEVAREGLREEEHAEAVRRRASAWYMVAYGEQQSDLLLGFPWVLTDILADIKRTAPMEREEEAAAAAAGDGAAAEATE